MSEDFDDAQRIVLHGTRWTAARHLMLSFRGTSPLHFLSAVLNRINAANNRAPELQFSVGFTRRGLERANVPKHVMARLALKSPAYWAGAARRATSHLGMADNNAPERWDPRFAYTTLDAVLSVHSADKAAAAKAVKEIRTSQERAGIQFRQLPPAASLPPPSGIQPREGDKARGQWVHFGYLDGLSRIGIKGWTLPDAMEQCLEISRHEAGEFLLGHLQDSGASPWVAGPGLRVWPDKVRAFFHNGSFCALQQIEQHVAKFERFVKAAAEATGLSTDEIKGKLGGRYPDGRPLAVPEGTDPGGDFDYARDPQGHACPFGSHVRRMNPRLPRSVNPQSTTAHAPRQEDFAAHFSRSRPLLRRGMPYGPPLAGEGNDDGAPQCGLIGLFFCASIEDQFEHLLGEWGDRVPLGSPDGGGARDPIIGAHEKGDGPFEILRTGAPRIRLDNLQPFTRTVGAAYLFYPSVSTLHGIAESFRWGADDEDDE